MGQQFDERRAAPRQNVFASVRYRYPGMKETDQGVLANISSTGLMLWTDREFCPDGEITVWLDSGVRNFPSIEVNAKVVRTEQTDDSRYAFGYGCRIVDV